MATTETDGAARDVEVRADDGLALRGRHWARPDPRGVVVLAHGFGEHLGRYEELARTVGASAGVDVAGVDFRGHGRSPGKRGVVLDYSELLDDLAAAFAWAGRERPGLPRFVLGHSNGGQVALRAALDPAFAPEVAGLVVSNPAVRIAVPVPGYQIRLGRFLRRHAPRVTLAARMRTDYLTHDPEIRRRLDADPLSHGRINAALFFGMVEGGAMILKRAGEITLPLLMILSGADKVVDPAASRLAFDRLGSPDKTLAEYPGMFHEPFNEVGRDRVYADLSDWLDRHLSV